MTHRALRIGISGSYGGLNLGDEAILVSIVRELRRLGPVEITVFSRDPEDTLARHDVERAVPVRSMGREEVRPEVARLDLFILGGGGILFDAEARTYLREVALAQEAGVPVVVYAVSAGPLKDAQVQEAVQQRLALADLVTVRDRQAQHLLEEIGLERPVVVTADPALLLEPQPLPDEAMKIEGLDGRDRLVGLSVREPGAAAPDLEEQRYHALLANAADFIVDRFDADIVFVPMERQVLDVQHSHAVVAQMVRAQRAHVLKGEYGAQQILSLVGHFDFVVGMRLHLLIFSALQRVPFVPLPYAPKVAGFISDLGIPMPPLDQVTAGQLIAFIDRWWDARDRIRHQIDEALPALQDRARQTGTLVRELLESRGLLTPPDRHAPEPEARPRA